MATKETPGKTAAPENKNVDFRVDLRVSETAEVFVYHARPFDKKLSWLEFDLDTNNLDFIMSDGDVRNFGAKVPAHLSKHMQNAYQVMMVQMDESTGKPLSGDYFPLIIHRA